jgi:hypothetical protein
MLLDAARMRQLRRILDLGDHTGKESSKLKVKLTRSQAV